MEVTYRINADDMQAAQWHYARTSKSLRATYWRSFFFLLAVSLGFNVLLVMLTGWGWTFGAISFVAFSVIWTVRWPHVYRQNLDRSMQKILKEGRNEVLNTTFMMKIDEGGFRVASDLGDSRVNWTVVERVEETEAHIFIMIGSMSVYAVPKWAFETKRRAEDFFEAAQTFHRRALA